MNNTILVLGYGPVGKATVEKLLNEGRNVQVAQRKRPADLPAGVTFKICDVLDEASLTVALKDVAQLVVALGFNYNSENWRKAWPRAMANLIAACSASDVRMVFVDNLYMYGPQTEALREDMPLTSFGVKPAVRAEITKLWLAASKAGKLHIAALRAPDFYGPHVNVSHLGDGSLGALAKGKTAQLITPLDTPHEFAYVPDIAKAVVTLLDAPDDAYGQAWHVPCAPTRTPREIISLGAASLGIEPKVSGLPLWLLPVIGLFIPMLREFKEMRFQLDRPYRVDAQKFSKRFWSDATPFEVGIPATMASLKS
jgi:nucleoside-diphosphate-sugar epimerase